MIFKRSYVRLVGIFLLIILLFTQDLDQLKSIFLRINLYLFSTGLLLIFPYIIIRSLRWNLIMKFYGIDVNITESTIIYFSALFAGLVSPGRLGEFIKIFYISERGHSYIVSFISVLLDRLWDIFTLIIIGLFGLWFFRDDFHLILYVYISFIFVFIFLSKINFLGLNFFKFNILPNSIKDNFEIFLSKFSDFKNIEFHAFFKLFLVNLIGWIVYFAQAFILARSLSLDIDFFFLVLTLSISGLVTLLPITFSGIGTRDAVFIFMFDKIGISGEMALVFSFTILLTYLFNGFIGFLAWQIKPIKGYSNQRL